jgi:hypothetical protein
MSSPFATRWADAALPKLYAEFGWGGMHSRGGLSAPVRLRGTRAQEAGDAGFGGQSLVRGAVTLKAVVALVDATALGGLNAGDTIVYDGLTYRVHGAPLKIGPRAMEYEFDLVPFGTPLGEVA